MTNHAVDRAAQAEFDELMDAAAYETFVAEEEG